eukprot:scaffold16549_cov117-Isochrysis_galbana.AAC.4
MPTQAADRERLLSDHRKRLVVGDEGRDDRLDLGRRRSQRVDSGHHGHPVRALHSARLWSQ